MAGIDYNISNQIKGVQVESPMNAMMQAMQLRGLQESSQMNALKAQEYQQDVAEKNALAQIYANPKLKYGSPEFFAQVAQHAPRHYEKIAAGEEKRLTGEAQRQTALSTQQTREQQRQEAEQKQRLAKREFGLRKIASAPDYSQAASLIERSVRTGELDREEADDMLSRLTPDADMSQFRSDVLTNLLPAEKALTAASEAEKAGLGVRKEKFELETKELDRDLAAFNKVYNPALISTTDKNVGRARITQRLRAMYEQPKLGAEAAKFMPYEEALKQHLAAYEQDPDNYVAATMGLTGEKIIEAREKATERKEKDIRAAYDEHVYESAMTNQYELPYSEFRAQYLAKTSGAPAAPAPQVQVPAPQVQAPAPQVQPQVQPPTAKYAGVTLLGSARSEPQPAPAVAAEPAPAVVAEPAPAVVAEPAPVASEINLPPVETRVGIPGISRATATLLGSTPAGRIELAKLAQKESSPAEAAKRNLDSQRLQADITHRQAMESIAQRSENRQADTAKETARHAKVMEGLQRNQYFLMADKPNQIANTQVDDSGTVTHFNARGQVIRSIPNAGKKSPALIKQEQARAEGLRTVESLIPDVEEMIKKNGLIDQSTGSGVGRLADVSAEFFGYATPGAVASSRLEPIAAMITMTVPRFEGPQSEADRKFYERAAGDLANPRLPAEQRKAAGEVVLKFMKQRKNQFILRGSELDAGGSVATEPPAGFVLDK